MATNIQFTELDFFRNKEALKKFLKAQDRFKDYDFEGSNMNVLLDVLAYNTHLNNYYVHSAFSETFLDTAQWRENINSHAKELNYIPQSRNSASARVTVFLNVTDNPSFVTIPRHTVFEGICNGTTYTFYNEEAVTIYPSNGVYSYGGLDIYEGKIVNELHVVDQLAPKRYYLNSDTIDTNSIRVYVRENTLNDAPELEFVRKNDIYDLKSDSKIFFIQPYLKYRYEVDFGKDVFGYEPKHNNVIRIEYRTTAGEDANGVRVFKSRSTIGGYTATCYTQSNSEGGAERESIEDIRFFAPKSIQIQNRAVTESDYEILLKNEFSEIQAISVYGGEYADPPEFGRAIIAVDIKNQDGVTTLQANKIKQFLSDKVPLAIEPVVVSPEFMWLEVTDEVLYNTAFTSKSYADINQLVKTAILNHSDTYLNDFKQTCRYSRLSKDIDDADPYIVSNSLQLRAVFDYNPVLNSAESTTFKFENSLLQDHGVALFDVHKPAIESSYFTHTDGTTKCKLVDDGNGKIMIVVIANNTYSIINSSIGTVDYATGLVQLKNFAVSGYEGNTIKLYANATTKDIYCPVGRIIGIREEDINISTIGIRE